MNRCLTGLIVVMVTVLWIAQISAQKNTQAETMLAVAWQKETVEGDLNGAMKQYKEIVAKYAKTDHATAAMALIRLADAYHRMGDIESRRLYQQVVDNYSDQKGAVALAKVALGGEPPAGPTSRTVWIPGFGTAFGAEWGTLSPDARFLSYTRDSDVFIHDLTTTTNLDRNFTNRPKDSKEYPFESVISPDGKRIAVVWKTTPDNHYTIRIATLTGDPNPQAVYATKDYPDVYDVFLHDWSRDGKTLALQLLKGRQEDGKEVDKEGAQIVLLPVSGGAPRVLKSVDWKGIGNLRLSPDGKYLGFNRSQADQSPGALGAAPSDVFILAVDGSSEIPAAVYDGNEVMVGWSPDGKWLLYTSDFLADIALSPDGQYIAAPSTLPGAKPGAEPSTVLLIPTSGGEARELIQLRMPVLLQGGWAPDSRSLLVRSAPLDKEILLVPLGGGEPKRLVDEDGAALKGTIFVSPDGRHYASTINVPGAPATSEIAVLENFLPKPAKK